MTDASETGFFGKLPAYGDFIYRNLPNVSMTVWDEWLQIFVKGSQEQIGEGWLDIYLTSPIWRFALSPGALDEFVWAGIMLPSVDRVGRYFPFSVLAKLPYHTNPARFICVQQEWYEGMEKLALSALNQELDLEELLAEMAAQALPEELSYTAMEGPDKVSNLVTRMEFEEQSPMSTFPGMLDVCIKNLLSSYSVWSTKGSERVEPSVFFTGGLPQGHGIAAMLDGDWQRWGWQEPYQLRAMAPNE